MSRISRVRIASSDGSPPAGLKGKVFDVALTGCDLLVGPNGAGKTARGPLAIAAALEGLATVSTDPRRPFIGPAPEHTSIVLTIDDGREVVRVLAAQRGKIAEEANEAARLLVGIPPTAWDLRDFASGTDGDRGKILDAAARAGGAIEVWDAARAQAHVGDLLESLREDRDDDLWSRSLAECVRVLSAAPDGAGWLRAALVWAEADQTKANAAKRAAEATMHEAAATIPPVVGNDEAADAAEGERLRREQVAIDGTAAERQRAEAAVRRHIAEGERLRREQVAIEGEGARLRTPERAPDASIPREVQERVDAALAAMDAPIPTYSGTVPADVDEATVLASRAAQEEALEADQHSAGVVAEAADDFAACCAAASAAEATLDALRALSDADAVCSHCGQADPLGIGPSVEKATLELAAARDARTAADLVLVAVQGTRESAQHRLVAATAEVERVIGLRARAAAWRADVEQREPSIRAQRASELAAAQAEYDREELRGRQQQADFERRKEQRTRDLAAARARWAKVHAALEEWAALPVPTVPPPPSEEERTRLAVELRTIEHRRHLRRDREAAISRGETASARYLEAKLLWDASRSLVSAIRQARDDVASAAYRPIHDAARALTEGVDGLPVVYFLGPDDYGAEVPGRGRVAYASLSESEQRITAAAIVYALATVAGCPCRLVLLDGLEVVQRSHRAPLLRALALAVEEGRVDSVVVTMATDPDEEVDDVDGVTVHRVDRETRAVFDSPVSALADTGNGAIPF